MNNISALMNLLEDEDQQIATMAMEQLLQLGDEILPALRQEQESKNALMRSL